MLSNMQHCTLIALFQKDLSYRIKNLSADVYACGPNLLDHLGGLFILLHARRDGLSGWGRVLHKIQCLLGYALQYQLRC
jgi:hypothetical protein